jgi:putative solute:sodium symporter small subunit
MQAENRTRQTHRRRSIVLALVALFLWAVFSFLLPLAGVGSDVTLFGLPLGSALALPVALPVLVLTAFWHAARQNAEDDRFREDD